MRECSNKFRISGIVCSLLVGFLCIVSCNNGKSSSSTPKDTVASSVFAPNVNDTTLNIDLSEITNIRFPQYKILRQQPIIPDSMSIAIDEETIASGNYSAVLSFDTIPMPIFYERIEQAAKHDTCWKIKENNYTYKRKDKQGGHYQLTFRKGSVQILISHLNADVSNGNKHQSV
ncbi:hypothetical protein J5A70_05550 [Prevotella nigrescens]|uniref:Uncharacterized protein n=2 Tax=Prevotella nigrescens TaxID=28133 RepID=A0A9D5WV36_9BACT|nr:hypothetical protein [Prevotella nigrescens]MBF1446378.1 hypothetical protein [Prevotella nigrescens]MBF1452514.1 hypothetical protein [Prevotella nigrescens]QUB48483.1 hypothetical protein J5A70_05550 [Prevotella nigrescens]